MYKRPGRDWSNGETSSPLPARLLSARQIMSDGRALQQRVEKPPAAAGPSSFGGTAGGAKGKRKVRSLNARLPISFLPPFLPPLPEFFPAIFRRACSPDKRNKMWTHWSPFLPRQAGEDDDEGETAPFERARGGHALAAAAATSGGVAGDEGVVAAAAAPGAAGGRLEAAAPGGASKGGEAPAEGGSRGGAGAASALALQLTASPSGAAAPQLGLGSGPGSAGGGDAGEGQQLPTSLGRLEARPTLSSLTGGMGGGTFVSTNLVCSSIRVPPPSSSPYQAAPTMRF